MDPTQPSVDLPFTPRPPRPVYVYDVPGSLQPEAGGATSFGLVALTIDEELTCIERAQGLPAKASVERIKEALREVNGKPVTTADGSADNALGRCGPKVRALLATAYNDVHNPEEKDVQGFLASRKVRVG